MADTLDPKFNTLDPKLTFAYNSFFADFLMSVKKASPELRAKVKKHYKTLDKRDVGHLEFAAKNLPIPTLSAFTVADIQQNSLDLSDFVAEGITLGNIIDTQDAKSLFSILYVLASIVRVANPECLMTLDSTMELVVKIKSMSMWAWPEPAPDIDAISREIGNVSDHIVRGLLMKLFEACAVMDDDDDIGVDGSGNVDGISGENGENLSGENGDSTKADMRDAFDKIQSSKIGSIAKEIAEEIDLSSLDKQNPEQWLDLANLTKPDSVLGNIVGKLTTKITNKMKNGELKQEDIFADAMNLMSTMGLNGPGGLNGLAGLGGALGAFQNMAGNNSVRRRR